MNNNSSLRKWRLVLLSLASLDALALAGAFFLAFWLRISSGLLSYGVEADLDAYIRLFVLSLPLFWLIFYAVRLYDPHDLFYGTMEYVLVTKAVTYGIIAVIVLGFFHHRAASRGWVFLFWPLAVLMVNSGRFAFRRLIRRRFRAGFGPDRALIVGASEEARAIARRLIETGRMEVRGFLDDFNPIGQEVIREIRIIGVPRDYEQIARREGATHIILVPGAVGWETTQELLLAATGRNGLQISLSPGFVELSASLRVSYVGYIPLLRFRPGYASAPDKLLKAGGDLVLGICFIVLCLPVMFAVALWILWRNGRPIFAKEEVLGKSGVPFNAFAFRISRDKSAHRSFYPESQYGENNLTDNIPFLENVLFRCGINKLPQLFNVILRKMSLVGPRPIAKEREHQYGIWLPSLLTVKPGITGPWAIQNTGNLQHEISQSLLYIHTWTPLKDLQFLLLAAFSTLQQCVPALFSHRRDSRHKNHVSATSKQRILPLRKPDYLPFAPRTKRIRGVTSEKSAHPKG